MKRSNLTLLILVICSLTFIAAIPVLYQRELKKANKTGIMPEYLSYRYPGIHVVKILDAKNITVIPSDSLTVEFKKNMTDTYKITESGDTLLVEGNARMIIMMPNKYLLAVNSEVLLRGDLYTMVQDAPSLSFILQNSRLYGLRISRDARVSQTLGALSIVDVGNSIVDLAGRFDIRHLHMENITRYSSTNEVNLWETSFIFDTRRDTKTLTCAEGMNIYNE